MTVASNQLLLRKNLTFTRSAFKHNKTVSVVLKLQIKNLLLSYIAYTKKRYFFLSGHRYFNSLNSLINTNILKSVLLKNKSIFSSINNDFFIKMHSYTGRRHSSGITLSRRSHVRFFVNHLLWKIIAYHRTFSMFTYGVACRFTRFDKLRRLFLSGRHIFYDYNSANKLKQTIDNLATTKDRLVLLKKQTAVIYKRMFDLFCDRQRLIWRFYFIPQITITGNNTCWFNEAFFLHLHSTSTTVSIRRNKRSLFFFSGRAYFYYFKSRVGIRYVSDSSRDRAGPSNNNNKDGSYFNHSVNSNQAVLFFSFGYWYYSDLLYYYDSNNKTKHVLFYAVRRGLIALNHVLPVNDSRDTVNCVAENNYISFSPLNSFFLLGEWWRTWAKRWRKHLLFVLLSRLRNYRFITIRAGEKKFYIDVAKHNRSIGSIKANKRNKIHEHTDKDGGILGKKCLSKLFVSFRLIKRKVFYYNRTLSTRGETGFKTSNPKKDVERASITINPSKWLHIKQLRRGSLRSLKSLVFSQYRLLNLVRFYSKPFSLLTWWGRLRSARRRRSQFSWSWFINKTRYNHTFTTWFSFLMQTKAFYKKFKKRVIYIKNKNKENRNNKKLKAHFKIRHSNILKKRLFRVGKRFSILWGRRHLRLLLGLQKIFVRYLRRNRMKLPQLIVSGSQAVRANIILPLAKFNHLYVSSYRYGYSSECNVTARFKFYVNYIKKVNKNFFVLQPARFWLVSRLVNLRKIRRFISKSLYNKFLGYRYKKNLSKHLYVGVRQALLFYTLFKKNTTSGRLSYFFSKGLDFVRRYFTRRLRRIKRKFIIAAFDMVCWNSLTVVRLTVLKLKRKPFSVAKMKRFEPEAKIIVHVQRRKLYSKLYILLTKILLSYRMTMLWLKLHSLCIFFNIRYNYIFDRRRLRRLLSTVRGSFYLRYYRHKPAFLNAIMFTLVSMYYKTPLLLNSNLAMNLQRSWKHRGQIFDTFKLISAVLWRNTFYRMSSTLNVKTVYMQIHGKVNSGTRTKQLNMGTDFKLSFLTLSNTLSFDFSTADARTGTFGIKTWFGY